MLGCRLHRSLSIVSFFHPYRSYRYSERERTDDTGIESKSKRAHATGRDQIYGSEEPQLAAHPVGKYVCTEYKKKEATQCAMITLYTRPPRITPPSATYNRAADLIRDGRGIL